MQEFFRKYGLYIVIGVFVLAAMIFVVNLREKPPLLGNTNLAFYIDEDNGDESVQPVSEIPPLIGKNGKPSVVRVYKYSCDDGKTSQPAYYLKYTDEAAAELRSLPPINPNDQNPPPDPRPNIIAKGELVRSPANGSPWVNANSEEGATIRSIPDCPGGKPAVIVSPRK